MAQPTNTYSSYDQVGIREDLTDVIHDVSPTDTPFYSSAGKTTASNTYHEWQTDALRAAASNAHIEGDDTVASTRSATVRLGNYTQIFKDAVRTTGTDMALNKAGRGDEMDYQMVKVGYELRLDVEKALLANQARVAGSDVVARQRRVISAGSPPRRAAVDLPADEPAVEQHAIRNRVGSEFPYARLARGHQFPPPDKRVRPKFLRNRGR